MVDKFTVLTEDGITTFNVVPGFEKASEELTEFIEYINKKYPVLSQSQAGWVSAFFVHNLSRLIEANPEMLETLDNVADYVSTNAKENE